MLSSLRPLNNVPAPVLLVLVAIATQRGVVHAQSPGNNNNPYIYWLSPGRIAGIAVGAIALIFLILSMLIFACRRRRHAKATSKVVVSNISGGGGHPQTFPSWQEAQQRPFGPDAAHMGWYYPAERAALSDQVKSAASSDQAQRTAPPGQVQSTAPFGEVQRTPPSGQVQRPAPASQGLSTVTSAQVQRTGPSGQAQSTVFSGQVQRIVPPGEAQRTAPPGQVQSIAPSGRTQSTTPLVRPQEQGAPPSPPRHAYTKEAPSAGAENGRDQSPPPYTPTGPPTPPAAHTAR